MDASTELHRAFCERADGVVAGDRPLVGLFGDGFPEAMIEASGAMAVDVKAPPLSDDQNGPDSPVVSAVVENFMDDFAARFLHRLATGTFRKFALILFARDDVAALTAYQYAQELRRQGGVEGQLPHFHLWNFVHTDSAAAAEFNRTEFGRLTARLYKVTGTRASDDDIAKANRSRGIRQTLLDQLALHGDDSFVCRNAGRWMTVESHVALLRDVVSKTKTQAPTRRIGIVGTACDLPVLHEICCDFGTVTADLQPYGQIWPARSDADDILDMLRQLARDPFHIRVNPPGRFTDALVASLTSCDIVVSSVDRNDDSFGWEVPALRQRLSPFGIKLIDLGFRPFRPDAKWIAKARKTVSEAVA